jgi:hypothetical protein
VPAELAQGGVEDAVDVGRPDPRLRPARGSEVADLLAGTPAYRSVFGPAGAQLATARTEALLAAGGPIDYPVGVIAGDRAIDPFGWLVIPGPNDGKVAVARTRLEGLADHIVLHTTHPTMLMNVDVAMQAIAFLRTGRFAR